MDKRWLMIATVSLILVVFLGYSVFGKSNKAGVEKNLVPEEKPTVLVDTTETGNREIPMIPVESYLKSTYNWEVFFSKNAISSAPVIVINKGLVACDGDGYKEPSILVPSLDWKAQIHVDHEILSAIVQDPEGNKELFQFKFELEKQ